MIVLFCLFSPPFILLSLLQELVFWNYKTDIFDWNSETGKYHLRRIRIEDDNKLELSAIKLTAEGKPKLKYFWANRKETYQNAPTAWKVYRFILEFVGILVGWNLIYFVIGAFSFDNLNGIWNLLLVLLLGLIGISGRIPVIIDSVQDWFKR